MRRKVHVISVHNLQRTTLRLYYNITTNFESIL